MREKMKKLSSLLAAIMICVMASPLVAFAADAEEYVPKMYASIWSLVPPVVAIALALITKEVYSSLFVGILVGGMFYSGFSFEGTITHIFQEGIVGVLSDSYNVGILIFLVILGTMVCLMNKAGGSTAFGEWASSHIKSRVGAQLATIVLGVLIFIDDYFNCLTVGSVMRPKILFLVGLHQGCGGNVRRKFLLHLVQLVRGEPRVQAQKRLPKIPGQQHFPIAGAAQRPVRPQLFGVVSHHDLPAQNILQQVARTVLNKDIFGVFAAHFLFLLTADQATMGRNALHLYVPGFSLRM